MTMFIGIVNPRQEAGKTAMAVNVAVSLALMEKKTLLVDGDPRGTATTMLSGGQSGEQSGLSSVLTGVADTEKIISPTKFDFLHDYLGMIPAGSGLLQAEQQLVSQSGRETVLRHAVRSVPKDIEYVVIDAPSSTGFLTTCVIAAVDFLLIPVPCRPESAVSLGSLLTVVRQVKKNLNPGLRIAGVVFTQCDGAEEIRSRIPADLLAGLKPVLLDIVIGRGDELQKEIPAVAADVMSATAEEYLDLAAILVEKKQSRAD